MLSWMALTTLSFMTDLVDAVDKLRYISPSLLESTYLLFLNIIRRKNIKILQISAEEEGRYV